MASTSAFAMVREALDQAELGVVGEDERERRVAQFDALLDVSLKLAAHVDQLSVLIASRSPPEKTRFPLSKGRGIEKVPDFAGNKVEFPGWTKRVCIYLGDDPQLRQILKEVRTIYRDKAIDDEILRELQAKHGKNPDDVQWYTGQVHDVLMMVTSGTPHSIVDNTNENGLEAWRQLHVEYANVTPQGKRSLLGLVLNFKKAKGYEDLLAVQAAWERALSKYEETPNTQKLTEDILISAYMNILPDKVADNLRNLDTE